MTVGRLPTLQERILALLKEQGNVSGDDMPRWLSGYDQVDIEPTLLLLMRQNKVARHKGHYSLTDYGRENPHPEAPRAPRVAVAMSSPTSAKPNPAPSAAVKLSPEGSALKEPSRAATAGAASSTPSAAEEASSSLAPKERRCGGKCQQLKPLDAKHFYPNPTCAGGFDPTCRVCRNAYAAERKAIRKAAQRAVVATAAPVDTPDKAPAPDMPAKMVEHLHEVSAATNSATTPPVDAGAAAPPVLGDPVPDMPLERAPDLTVQVDPRLLRAAERRAAILDQIAELQCELEDLDTFEELYRKLAATEQHA